MQVVNHRTSERGAEVVTVLDRHIVQRGAALASERQRARSVPRLGLLWLCLVTVALLVTASGGRAQASPGSDIRSARAVPQPRSKRKIYPNAWLQGRRLSGLMRDEARQQTDFIELHHFHGDKVVLERWGAGGGRRRELQAAASLVGFFWVERRCDGQQQRCREILYRIAEVRQDGSHNTMHRYQNNADIALYRVEYAELTSRGREDLRWGNVCLPDRSGFAGGMFVDGRWMQDGSWEPGGYTFSCAGGVISKCARVWGYKHWKTVTTDSGEQVSLRRLHLACTRAVRADYCGDGHSHTRDGVPIMVVDQHGLNRFADPQDLTLEAAFTSRGAVWMQRTRLVEPTTASPSGTLDGVCSQRPAIERAETGLDRDELLWVWSPRAESR